MWVVSIQTFGELWLRYLKAALLPDQLSNIHGCRRHLTEEQHCTHNLKADSSHWEWHQGQN